MEFKPTATFADWTTFLHVTDNGPGDARRVLSLWMTPNSFGALRNQVRMHDEFDGTTSDTGVIPGRVKK